MVDQKSSVELWNMGTGKMHASHVLQHSPNNEKWADMIFLGKPNDSLSKYAIMSNSRIEVMNFGDNAGMDYSLNALYF